MILFNRQNGVVKIEMNEKDAEDLAKVISRANANNFDFNLSQMTIVIELPKLLLEKDSSNSEEDALASPEYYFHVERGDLYMINWKRNRPTEDGWVKITEEAYRIISGR